MHLSRNEFLFLAATMAFLVMLFGCSVPNVDTNGYQTRMPEEHLRYCQVTKGKVISFVPCDEVKHDISL